jgi:prepilin-type N-terminal cleavage/methylation domain-containing protein
MKAPGPRRPETVGGEHSGIRGGSSQTSAFTLVEMLVVVSIILIVAVVALPAITSLSKSASRRSAVSLVMAALDQARAQAVAQSGKCFFVFANDDAKLVFSTGENQPPADYRYRAFAVFQEVYIPPQPGASAEEAANPYRLLPVRAWTLLPEGVSFRPDEAPRNDDSPPPPRTIFTGKKSEPAKRFYCQPAKVEVELPYIEFNATGAVENPKLAEFARVKLFEGYVDANGNAVATNAARTLAEETIALSLYTGRAKREEINATN